jgi:hypothetical protein
MSLKDVDDMIFKSAKSRINRLQKQATKNKLDFSGVPPAVIKPQSRVSGLTSNIVSVPKPQVGSHDSKEFVSSSAE